MDEIDGLVFLPGMMCDWRLFAPQIAALGDAYPITIADLSRADSIAGMAKAALAAAPPRFVALGLSMGGIVAFEVWRQAPQRVRGLVLMDTNARAEPPERQAKRAPQVQKVMAGGLRAVLEEELMPFYLAGRNQADLDLRARITAMAVDCGPEVFKRQSAALAARPDSVASLASIACPSLVLCGEEDRMCPVARHREIADGIGDAALCILPGCGHLPTLEAPDAVLQAVRPFLENHFTTAQGSAPYDRCRRS